METTGRPFTVKCFSNFWPAPNAAAGKKNTLAPITGSRVRFNLEGWTVAGHMLVNAPSAIEHRGQQFRLLLIGNREIFTSQLVVGVFLQTALTLFNELVQGFEVLAEGNVNTILIRKTRRLDYTHVLLNLPELLTGYTERFIYVRNQPRIRYLHISTPVLYQVLGRLDAQAFNLNDKSGNNGKTERSSDRAAVQKLPKVFQPRSPNFSRRLGGTLNNALRFQLIFQRNPNAGWGFNFTTHLFRASD